MTITDEILAAYADGTLPEDQLPEVRRYLSEHPEELEQIIILMDRFHEGIIHHDQTVSSLILESKACKFSKLNMNETEFTEKTNFLDRLDSLLYKIV